MYLRYLKINTNHDLNIIVKLCEIFGNVCEGNVLEDAGWKGSSHRRKDQFFSRKRLMKRGGERPNAHICPMILFLII